MRGAVWLTVSLNKNKNKNKNYKTTKRLSQLTYQSVEAIITRKYKQEPTTPKYKYNCILNKRKRKTSFSAFLQSKNPLVEDADPSQSPARVNAWSANSDFAS